MKRISARYLLNYTTEQLKEMLVGDFILVFEDNNSDNSITTNFTETIYSSHFWDFHRKYPNTPILKIHHVSTVLDGKDLRADTHRLLVSNIYNTVAQTYNLNTPEIREDLTRLVYETTNRIYNDLSVTASEFMFSIDILDFIEVQMHPVVFKIMAELDGSKEGLEYAYKEILNVIMTDPVLDENNVAIAVRGKMVNANQVLQCVGPRGYPTEIDGAIMPTPILESFTTGMRSVYDLASESRTLAHSLAFSEAPLQKAEYFSRRLQLLCMPVEKVIYGDCGGDYIEWPVRGPINKDGVTTKGDLIAMEGNYYLDEETNTLKDIKVTDTHLYGKTIKLRNATKCKLSDPTHICSACFGKMADNLHMHGNVGHQAGATMGQIVAQGTLSSKHLTASGESEPIVLREAAFNFLAVNKKRNCYLIQDTKKYKNFTMSVPQGEALGLADINKLAILDDINLTRVSEISELRFNYFANNSYCTNTIPVFQGARRPSFTREFLHYLQLHKYTIDDSGNFSFDLVGWDFNKPVLIMPEMEHSLSAHSMQVASIIESRMKDIGDRQKPESPISTLLELFDLVNSKMTVNLSLLSVIMYATMVRDGMNNDFALARNSDRASLHVARSIISGRSMSAVYAYQYQTNSIFSPSSFFNKGRPDSPMDIFIHPKEVLAAYSKINIT